MDKIKFYTWKDVERCLMLNKYLWEKEVLDIEVYPFEMIITLNDLKKIPHVQNILKNILGDIKDDFLVLELGNEKIDIIYAEDRSRDIERKSVITPLFRKVLYQEKAYYEDMIYAELSGVPVIAFHSYKGGVGRTLSVLAFAKAWSSLMPDERLLIVDSDIEAPGLTWLWKEKGEVIFSYLDLLEFIQLHTSAEEIGKLVSDKMKRMMITIETEKMMAEHFFLPTYRYEEQFLDIYSSPTSIAQSYNKKYLITETLSELGEKLGAAAVLIDLRAGISEFSAPVLFDPRVKKYIVSSTSYQSIKGTELLLQQIVKGLPITPEAKIPEILLTMVMDGIDTGDLTSELISILDQTGVQDSLTDNIITELPFASELVHLESLSQIMKKLDGREFYKSIFNLVKDNYASDIKGKQVEIIDRKNIINKIHQLAKNQINAEGNMEFNVLLTQSINNLIKRFENTVPTTVVMGAKGAGKTFLYREIVRSQYWEKFVSKLSMQKYNEENILVIPLLAARNVGEIQTLISECIVNYSDLLEGTALLPTFCMDNAKKVVKFAREMHDKVEWEEFWQALFLAEKFDNLEQMNQKLGSLGKKALFVIDGLEEILEQTLSNKTEKNAILALCQDFLNGLKVAYKNIGCIVFLRKDIARNSIEVNFEQFNTIYKEVELNWSKTEALRLVLWLVNQAVPGFYKEAIPIELASAEIIETNLVKLWGNKLGKDTSNEAYSSRWILAALSDFNGQLQARDIIRFLQNATEEVGKSIYDDRYIMPTEIKRAVPSCSVAKIDEIRQEIKVLQPILEKFENAPSEKKVLPFGSDTFDLSAKEEQLLKQEGYLRIDNDKYYLPEIIRHALKFKYEKGARPKVLSLLSNK